MSGIKAFRVLGMVFLFGIAGIAGMGLSQPARAASFVISNETSDYAAGSAPYILIFDMADQIESQINNSILSGGSQENFLGAMSDATVGATKGIGVDYASNPRRFVVGGNASLAISGSTTNMDNSFKSSVNSLPGVGGSVQGTALVGINLGSFGVKNFLLFDGNRTNLYLNFLSLSRDVGDSFSVELMNIGAHMQYKFVSPKGNELIAQWGGLDFITGLEYAHTKATYQTQLNVTQTQSDFATSGDQLTLRWNSTFDVNVNSSVFTIPFEISSNVRFLHLFSLFMGTGIDFNFGSSSINGGATGPITSSYTGAGVVPANIYSATGTADLGEAESQAPTVSDVRIFGGFQFNMWALRFVAQATYMSNSTMGLLLGVRMAL